MFPEETPVGFPSQEIMRVSCVPNSLVLWRGPRDGVRLQILVRMQLCEKRASIVYTYYMFVRSPELILACRAICAYIGQVRVLDKYLPSLDTWRPKDVHQWHEVLTMPRSSSQLSIPLITPYHMCTSRVMG